MSNCYVERTRYSERENFVIGAIDDQWESYFAIVPRVHYISTDTHFSIWTNISCNLEKSFLQFGQIHFANSLIGAIDDPCIVMGKLYFTPLLCHYGECTIYPPRCYDKQPSSLFVRYNLSFVIRFNIELRPLASSSFSSSSSICCYPFFMVLVLMIDADEDDDDDDADVTLPLSLASAHLFPAPNLARHTLPSNDLYPVYVRICTILEKQISTFQKHRFVQTWYMPICARLLIQKLESNQSKSTNCSKFRPCEHETPIFSRFCTVSAFPGSLSDSEVTAIHLWIQNRWWPTWPS